MNYKEFLRSWSPWHLHKRIAELQQQRTANYTGLMTECEKLKEENERLKQEVERLKSTNQGFCEVFERSADDLYDLADRHRRVCDVYKANQNNGDSER